MLTGDPRTATVRASGDVQVLEIAAGDIRRLAEENPGFLEHISTVVAARRVGLAQAEATAAAAAAEQTQTPDSLLARIRSYLAL
jgi:CRP-like cAMP-binding protein